MKTRAHPHSRGENLCLVSSRHIEQGSSPLTRGKPDAQTVICELAGLIPTHAGKTAIRFAVRRFSWAHPHSRGENFISFPHYVLRGGSSPLTRGKLPYTYDMPSS